MATRQGPPPGGAPRRRCRHPGPPAPRAARATRRASPPLRASPNSPWRCRRGRSPCRLGRRTRRRSASSSTGRPRASPRGAGRAACTAASCSNERSYPAAIEGRQDRRVVAPARGPARAQRGREGADHDRAHLDPEPAPRLTRDRSLAGIEARERALAARDLLAAPRRSPPSGSLGSAATVAAMRQLVPIARKVRVVEAVHHEVFVVWWRGAGGAADRALALVLRRTWASRLRGRGRRVVSLPLAWRRMMTVGWPRAGVRRPAMRDRDHERDCEHGPDRAGCGEDAAHQRRPPRSRATRSRRVDRRSGLRRRDRVQRDDRRVDRDGRAAEARAEHGHQRAPRDGCRGRARAASASALRRWVGISRLLGGRRSVVDRAWLHRMPRV